MKKALLVATALTATACVVAASGAVVLARTSAASIDEWRMRALSTHDFLSTNARRMAAWSGNGDASLALGAVLIVENDAARARESLKWLTHAADAGNHDAQYMLGRTLFNGAFGVAPDFARSRSYPQRAAQSLPPDSLSMIDDEQGHAPAAAAQAAYLLSSIYRNGYGVARDDARGIEWLMRAASAGVPAAQLQLANVYRQRGADATALVWLRRAANAEYPEANLALAIAYRNGELGLHRSEGEYWAYVKETLHDYRHRSAN